MTAMDDGPVTGRDLDDAATVAISAHAAGRPCHTGCPGTADCRQLAWAHSHVGDVPTHEPHRPGWTCTGCPIGTPWPCEPARTRLLDAYAGDRIRVVVDLTTMLRIALEETDDDPAELYERLILWTRAIPSQPDGLDADNGERRRPDVPRPGRRPWWHRRRI